MAGTRTLAADGATLRCDVARDIANELQVRVDELMNQATCGAVLDEHRRQLQAHAAALSDLVRIIRKVNVR